jgi:formylglycine-generating enzyme
MIFRVNISAAITMLCLLVGSVAEAQTVQIVGFDRSTITWTNAPTNGVFTLEWADSPTGTWAGNWNGLNHQPITGAVMSARLPAYFRVVHDPIVTRWIGIGNPHNLPDGTGYGAVNYNFHIGKFEVDNEQYTIFLNAVDPSGGNARNLYNGNMGSDLRGGITKLSSNPSGAKYIVKTNMMDKPVIYVSFFDACRFCNWLHNGQGSGSTETGAYDLTATEPPNLSVTRSPFARYFLPNENEWYKAAYYSGANTYYLYPTHANTAPVQTGCNSNGDLNVTDDNLANYNFTADWNSLDGNVTTVGSGGFSAESQYGCADMAGNVFEWNEAIIETNSRCIRGGCWFSLESHLRSTFRHNLSPSLDFDSVGFRIASP